MPDGTLLAPIPFVTLRLTHLSDERGPVIKIDGRLEEEVLPELRQACDAVQGTVRLDLADLFETDLSGVRALRELRLKGAELRNVRPFLKLLLEEGT